MPKDSTSNRRAKPPATPLPKRPSVDGRRVTEPRSEEGWDLDPAAVSADYASMVSRQLVGVWHKSLVEPVARALSVLKTDLAWVVHGEDGLDVDAEALLALQRRLARSGQLHAYRAGLGARVCRLAGLTACRSDRMPFISHDSWHAGRLGNNPAGLQAGRLAR